MKFIRLRTLISAILISGCASNSATWMQDSSSYISNKKITDLTIPGAHIANAYDINKKSMLCKGEILPQSYSNNGQIYLQVSNESDSEDKQNLFLAQLNTQDNDIAYQLQKGMRYLELQICAQSQEFYTSNVYLTENFADIAEQINRFTIGHPDEIIILDFDNNLRSESGYMTPAEIGRFHDYLTRLFGTAIVPKNKMYQTISELQNQHYQIIILSSNPTLISYPDIWDKNQIANSIDAQSATIKKLSLLEMVLGGNTQLSHNKINILPIYPDLKIDDLTEETNEDSQADQSILMNYLQLNITNHPAIIVANKINAASLENLIIQQDINEKINTPHPYAETESISTFESETFDGESITFESESYDSESAVAESGLLKRTTASIIRYLD